jgi:DNA-binding transcriptional ArsR family regulator
MPTETDQLSLTFAALADPTRRSILTRLAEGEATVNELAEPFRSASRRSRGTSRCSSAPG